MMSISNLFHSVLSGMRLPCVVLFLYFLGILSCCHAGDVQDVRNAGVAGAFAGDQNEFVLEADVSIVEQRPIPSGPSKEDLSTDAVIKEKKVQITWESLGLQSVRESLKKINAKSLLSAISLKYLYRHLLQLALSEHDRYVGDPYELEEAAAVKLAHAQTVLMQDYVHLLSDPELMSQIMHAQNGDGVANSSRLEQLATSDMVNLLSPAEAVDFFVYELSQQPFFPKDLAEYGKIKKLAIQWGAIPIGLIVLGTKLNRDNLGGQIYLPVFMLPSGYLGLAFTARIDHIGFSLSPRLVGQGEVVLMRFRVKGTMEEKRGKLFSQEARNFELELSEDWSNLFLKRFGLNSHFYYKNRHQNNLLEGIQDNIHEIGWNVNSNTPGRLLGVIPYTNFSTKMSIDSQKNVQTNLLLKQVMPNYFWSVVMNGAFNFSTREGNLTGQVQITKPLANGSTGVTAGLNVQAGTASRGVEGFVGITEESRNLSGRLQFSLQENHGDQHDTQLKWRIGIGIAGQLENQKRLDEKYLRRLDYQMRSNVALFEHYEADLSKNVYCLVQRQSSPDTYESFEKGYQALIVPVAFSLEQVGQTIERSSEEYKTLVIDFERKYRIHYVMGESQTPEKLSKMNSILARYRDLKAKGPANLKSSILFLALAEHVMAD